MINIDSQHSYNCTLNQFTYSLFCNKLKRCTRHNYISILYLNIAATLPKRCCYCCFDCITHHWTLFSPCTIPQTLWSSVENFHFLYFATRFLWKKIMLIIKMFKGMFEEIWQILQYCSNKYFFQCTLSFPVVKLITIPHLQSHSSLNLQFRLSSAGLITQALHCA